MKQASILVIEDDVVLRDALTETLCSAGYGVIAHVDAEKGLEALTSNIFDALITDVQLPGMDGYSLLKEVKRRNPELPVLIITAYGTVNNAVEAMRLGAVDYLVKPFDAELLVTKLTQIFNGRADLTQEFIAEDNWMRKVVDLAARVAPMDATVMISGESGTGKEVLARFIHRLSTRAKGPFVAINCAAIPENMLEAILFGYEKGAFTGALKSTPGKFEQAQGGTLLLDEISEMDIALQSKLLRVLQEREVERIGSQHTVSLDVRILATTNRQLREEVEKGRFREDLFFRLNVFPLRLPPLRERPMDIIPLASYLLQKHAHAAKRSVPQLSDDMKEALLAHNWSGNVRELDNLLQRALILHKGDVICNIDPGFDTYMSTATSLDTDAISIRTSSSDSLDQSLKAREQSLIMEILKDENGSRKNTAERLGISPRTLRYKLAQMREAGIQVAG